MKHNKLEISLLPNIFLNKNQTFNKDEAINLCGHIAGVCYDEEGFNSIKDEPTEKTNKRIELTLNNGHHSVYDHIMISFNIQNIPKILAMIINNEHQYTTSEKSARYTKIKKDQNSIISDKEIDLYNKWLEIFKKEISLKVSAISENKTQKLAQENARYLITIFMPTQMIYTTSFRQINYIASWMKEYIKNAKTSFENKIAIFMEEFLKELKRLNVLEDRLMNNEKCRSFSIFGNNLDSKNDYFSNIYTTTYEGSFAEYAQAQRHRTLDYKLEILSNKKYYIPRIIIDNDELTKMWIKDISSVSDVYPQGEIVLINEIGKYEDFILKCKERLCSSAQLEIRYQTKDTLTKYKEYLESTNNCLKNDIKKYCNGPRCTFKDFTCSSVCKNPKLDSII